MQQPPPFPPSGPQVYDGYPMGPPSGPPGINMGPLMGYSGPPGLMPPMQPPGYPGNSNGFNPYANQYSQA